MLQTLTKRLEKKLGVQHWTSPGSNTPQGTNYTTTCLPSRKLSKLDEPDMQDTAGTYIQQLCEDTWCSPEYLPEMMNDREKWREKVRDIRASGTTWWWWWWWWKEQNVRFSLKRDKVESFLVDLWNGSINLTRELFISSAIYKIEISSK